VRTWNPIKINFLQVVQLAKDAWHTKRWADKLRIWLMPTGWRPADVAARYPLVKIDDPHHFEKYDPASPTPLVAWAWVQLLAMLLIIGHLFAHIAQIGSPDMFIYGAFVFASVYAYTELMDGNKWAPWLEVAKNAVGLAIIVYTGNWFGAAGYYGIGSVYGLFGYFVAGAGVTAWLSRRSFHGQAQA
jgi:alkylglycerol monooxygenase